MGKTRNQALCAARPEDGVGLYFRSHLPRRCNSEAMALHLAELSLAVAPGAHALVLLDQAGWHVSKKLPVPTTSHSCHCRRSHPNSTRWKISGNSCATTGYPTASSTPTTAFSAIVAAPGTSSSTCPGKS